MPVTFHHSAMLHCTLNIKTLHKLHHLSHTHTHTHPIFPQSAVSTQSRSNINVLLSSFPASSSDFFRCKLHPGFCIHFLEGNCSLKLTEQPFEARMSSTKFLTSVKTTFNLICRQFPTSQ